MCSGGGSSGLKEKVFCVCDTKDESGSRINGQWTKCGPPVMIYKAFRFIYLSCLRLFNFYSPDYKQVLFSFMMYVVTCSISFTLGQPGTNNRK